MKNFRIKISYSLLLLSSISAILALSISGFIFKSGTAGIGIIILFLLQITQPKTSRDLWFVIGAFFFSILGDWFLSNMQGDPMKFSKGIALYLLAHCGYLVFALLNGKIKWGLTGGLLMAFLVYYFLILYPVFNDQILMIATLIYLLVSVFSLSTSAGIQADPIVKWSYVFGIFLILFSDMIISFKEFLKYDSLNFLILPTYYLAHISITFSLIRKEELVDLKSKN
ncbi:MAG: lysoplasmalogenase [Bacteroidota bacterium]